MEDNNEYGYAGAVGWFLAGSVAGACAALLFAPATGKKTREQLARKFRNTRESVTDFTDDLAEKAGRISDKAARLAGSASAAAREVIGSLSDQTERVAKR
jgi:gas vesicle protein